MNNIRKKVVIAGAGQLGSRYLQGVAKILDPLDVYVLDISEASLKLAESRWLEVAEPQSQHLVSYVTNIDALPDIIDLVIVSTSANSRAAVVSAITEKAKVDYWILEKVLAQSAEQIGKIETCLLQAKGVWVNTPRRITSLYKRLKHALGDHSSPIKLTVTGNDWGLACNSVHFLDLVAWLTNEKLENIKTEHLENNWFESKRQGFYEVCGEIQAFFSGGTIVNLISSQDKAGQGPLEVALEVANVLWQINEEKGEIHNNIGDGISGKLEFQSELTASVVTSILRFGCCDLPAFSESAELHNIFLRDMLLHWNRFIKKDSLSIPIT